MGQKPMRATDRRRNYHKVDVDEDKSESGHGRDLADLFNDRRHHNGSGKRAR